MTLKNMALSVLRVFVGSSPKWPQDAQVMAEDLAHSTDLTQAEAIVVAGDVKGLDEKDIQHQLAYSTVTVRQVRRQLRQKYREMDGEIGTMNDTRDALEKFVEAS